MKLLVLILFSQQSKGRAIYYHNQFNNYPYVYVSAVYNEPKETDLEAIKTCLSLNDPDYFIFINADRVDYCFDLNYGESGGEFIKKFIAQYKKNKDVIVIKENELPLFYNPVKKELALKYYQETLV